MENINFIFPEIFISLSIMFLLVFGVFKKNSSSIVYLLTIITLIIALGLIINFPKDQEINLFNNSYKIDQLSIFMKVITIVSGIFVLVSSYNYTKLEKISNIEYSIDLFVGLSSKFKLLFFENKFTHSFGALHPISVI